LTKNSKAEKVFIQTQLDDDEFGFSDLEKKEEH